MRTVILLGLVAIAEAIDQEWMNQDAITAPYYGVALGIVICMDIFEFVKRAIK